MLKDIVEHKKEEIALAKQVEPLRLLQDDDFYNRETRSLTKLIGQLKYVLIAEFKRRSPSKGMINESANHQVVVPGYIASGADACSVLCDQKYFAGNLNDLQSLRDQIKAPLLRKDFIIDPYQVYQSKAYGADLILLIARILTPDQFSELASLAKSLGLEVLLEIHSLDELEVVDLSLVDILGVNNRDLNTFETSIQHSIDLAASLPDNVAKISESGINSPEDAKSLLDSGYNGFLIGEQFMRAGDPARACADFINGLKKLC